MKSIVQQKALNVSIDDGAYFGGLSGLIAGPFASVTVLNYSPTSTKCSLLKEYVQIAPIATMATTVAGGLLGSVLNEMVVLPISKLRDCVSLLSSSDSCNSSDYQDSAFRLALMAALSIFALYALKRE